MSEAENEVQECLWVHGQKRIKVEIPVGYFFGIVSMVQFAMAHTDFAGKLSRVGIRQQLERWVEQLPPFLWPIKRHLVAGWAEVDAANVAAGGDETETIN